MNFILLKNPVFNSSALMNAIEKGNTEVAKMLIRQGANLDIVDTVKARIIIARTLSL